MLIPAQPRREELAAQTRPISMVARQVRQALTRRLAAAVARLDRTAQAQRAARRIRAVPSKVPVAAVVRAVGQAATGRRGTQAQAGQAEQIIRPVLPGELEAGRVRMAGMDLGT